MNAMPPPKFATARDLSAPTRGILQSRFADVWLRQPFMPWQNYVAEVAGELTPEGRPRYPLVVVTLPRQGGKSHLSCAITGERCMSCAGYRAWYTAQTGGDARDQFLKFAGPESHMRAMNTPLASITNVLVGNGREVLRFPNGSQWRPHPPTEKALHGKQSDRNDIDEAWAFTEDEGRALMQAIAPTQLTRPGAQTWIWSAGGTAASTWLANLVARGRAGLDAATVEGGDPVAMAYFEWGIPDDMPLTDLEAIARCHPAYGHTIDLAAMRNLRVQFGDDEAGFARAAGNRWTEVIGGAIKAPVWQAVQTLEVIPEAAPLGYGAARAEDGSEVVIAAACRTEWGTLVEILAVLPTAHGAAEHVGAWVGRSPVAVSRGGASTALFDDLTIAGVPTLAMTDRDDVAACGQLTDALPHKAYRFRPNDRLNDAVRVAGRRRVAKGGHVWALVTAGASIAALEAATNAAWAVNHRPPPGAKPVDRAPQ